MQFDDLGINLSINIFKLFTALVLVRNGDVEACVITWITMSY